VTRIALALLCSCTPGSAVAFRVVDTRQERDDVLLDACDYWMLDCEETDSPNGAVTLFLTERGAVLDDGRIRNGVCTHEKTCNPIIYSIGDALTLAHEIGHCVGWMDDRDDEENIMHDDPGIEASEKQERRVHRGAKRLAVCVGGVRP
jgi:hypothetical protein